MRHVTPYSCVEYAIKGIVQKVEGKYGHKKYIDSIVDVVLPLIRSKEGICLTAKQYDTFVNVDNIIPESFKLTTTGS